MEGQEKRKTSKLQILKRVFFIIFNFAYIIAYSIYTGYTLAKKNTAMEWLPYLLAVFILIYLIVFIAVLIDGSKQKVKSTKKDFKTTFKILKQVLKLVNLALAIAMLTNTVINDKKSVFALVLTCVSIPIVALQIVLTIVKFVKRKKKEKVKLQKSDIKKEFANDIKQMLTQGKQEVFGTNEDGTAEILADSTVDSNQEDNAQLLAVSDEDNAQIDVTKKSSARKAIDHASKIAGRVKQYKEDIKSVDKKKK